jgi:exonuclease III
MGWIYALFDLFRQTFRFAAFFGIAILLGSSMAPVQRTAPEIFSEYKFDGELSVLTYNVKGLPWPLANDRPQALQLIAERLKKLRSAGRHPEVVLLQEAFIDDARNIGELAGYGYIAEGPSASDQNPARATREELQFAEAGSWMKGENIGKLTGSGLQILSDFPITSIHKTPFPDHACAGYDCLSNKGVMLVDIYVAPLHTSVQVGNIHMNAKRHSRVSIERRLFAYQRQVDAAYDFFEKHRNRKLPIIFGGDFNIGYMTERADILFEKNWPVKFHNDALRTLASRHKLIPDAQFAKQKAADWQFSTSGTTALIQSESVAVPFGKDQNGNSLSDHIGYTINYRIDKNIGDGVGKSECPL